MPINRDQFSLQVDRLADAFGDKAFADQRTHLMWEAVKDLEYPVVIGMVDQFLRTMRTAPLPIDFIEAANASGNSSGGRALGEIRPREICRCLDCGDSGFVQIERRENYEPWAKVHSGSAACHCERGYQVLSKLRNLPRGPVELKSQFGDKWRMSYKIRPAYGVAP